MPPSFNTTSLCSVLYDDVLREIFITCCVWGPKFKNLSHCFVVGGDKPSICDLPQLSLSRVCHSWRHVALCTPQLWNNITIKKITKANLGLARAYLSRAGNVPISIAFEQGLTDEQDWLAQPYVGPSAVHSQLTDFLSSYRLQTLVVFPKLSFYLLLPHLSQRSVADLESLRIFEYNEGPIKGSIDLNDIRYPKLAVVHLRGVYTISGYSTSLRIFDGVVLLMTVTESWDLLSRCPSLEEVILRLRIMRDDGTSRRPESVPLIQLQRLRILNLYSEAPPGEIPFSTFIEALSLPVIENLWVSHLRLAWSSTAFQSFASRSNCFPYLSDIYLENPTSVVDTGAFLASMPSLKNMTFHWGSSNKNVVFDHLVLNGLASGSLAPRLQCIIVGCISNEGEFLDMVESRMNNAQMSSDVVPAPFTKISYWAPYDHDSVRLRDMRQRGIPIEARGYCKVGLM